MYIFQLFCNSGSKVISEINSQATIIYIIKVVQLLYVALIYNTTQSNNSGIVNCVVNQPYTRLLLVSFALLLRILPVSTVKIKKMKCYQHQVKLLSKTFANNRLKVSLVE